MGKRRFFDKNKIRKMGVFYDDNIQLADILRYGKSRGRKEKQGDIA